LRFFKRVEMAVSTGRLTKKRYRSQAIASGVSCWSNQISSVRQIALLRSESNRALGVAVLLSCS